MQKVRKAVIPVAGMGTRFLPATKSVPKELFPIIDKPTIQFIVEEAVESGIEEILLITSPYKNSIIDYFDKSYELESRLEKTGKDSQLEMIRSINSGVKIYSIRQGEPMGSGHAINLAKSFIGDETFAVMYGDDLIYHNDELPVLKQLINLHEKTGGNVIGGMEVPDELLYKYGICKLDGDRIVDIVEKPSLDEAPSNFANTGRYIVSSNIFKILDNLKVGKSNEYQFTDAMKEQMKTEPYYVCPYKGTYYDIGNQLGYIKATIRYALDRDDLKEELNKYLNEIISK